MIAGLSLMKAHAQEYEFENTADFIKKYQSPGPKINRDSIYNLPAEQRREIFKAARKRAVRIEIDTVNIKKVEDVFFIYGFFDRGLNMIRLNYYVLDKNCDLTTTAYRAYNIDEISQMLDEANAELPYNFIHELAHLKDSYLNTGALTPNQLAQFEINSEIGARLGVLVAKNPKYDANRLITVVLAEMRGIYQHYAENNIPDLIRQRAETNIQYQKNFALWIRKKIDDSKLDTTGINVENFDKIFRLQYTFDDRCLLDELKPETMQKLLSAIKKYAFVPVLQKAVKELDAHQSAKNIPTILALSNIPEYQKYDVMQR